MYASTYCENYRLNYLYFMKKFEKSDNGQKRQNRETEELITKKDVAGLTSKDVRTIDNWMRKGILPYYKCGRTVMFRWSDVQAHLDANFRICRRNEPAGIRPE